jgi:hypothetical protein
VKGTVKTPCLLLFDKHCASVYTIGKEFEMKWAKKIPTNLPALGERRVIRKFLFVPRRFRVDNEIRSYWFEYANVIEQYTKFKCWSGDHIIEPYQEWFEYAWMEVGIEE